MAIDGALVDVGINGQVRMRKPTRGSAAANTGLRPPLRNAVTNIPDPIVPSAKQSRPQMAFITPCAGNYNRDVPINQPRA